MMYARIIVPISSDASVQALLDTLTAINVVFLKSHGDIPPLYSSRVRYKRERPGREEWLTIPIVIQRGFGDCEDLACWRAAELRCQGIEARAVAYHSAPHVRHIVVLLPSGETEDPSRELGMGKQS